MENHIKKNNKLMLKDLSGKMYIFDDNNNNEFNQKIWWIIIFIVLFIIFIQVRWMFFK
jgi:hypothetical protein